MGCYGIGVNRILASLIETKHDANGIIWPMSLAPYEVIVSSLNAQEAEVAGRGRQALRRTASSSASTCCTTIATSAPA